MDWRQRRGINTVPRFEHYPSLPNAASGTANAYSLTLGEQFRTPSLESVTIHNTVRPFLSVDEDVGSPSGDEADYRRFRKFYRRMLGEFSW